MHAAVRVSEGRACGQERTAARSTSRAAEETCREKNACGSEGFLGQGLRAGAHCCTEHFESSGRDLQGDAIMEGKGLHHGAKHPSRTPTPLPLSLRPPPCGVSPQCTQPA